MKTIRSNYEILTPCELNEHAVNAIYSKIETAARTCYKSENLATGPDSARRIVSMLIENKHEAMLEHAVMTVRFTVDRAIANEIARHRMASFAQESTRYCNYSKDKFDQEVTFIEPYIDHTSFKLPTHHFYDNERQKKINQFNELWTKACEFSEKTYMDMLKLGCSPEIARSVLNLSLKTDIVVTANMREWRHIMNLRAAGTTGRPHPQMREIMLELLNELKSWMPEIFGDISEN